MVTSGSASLADSFVVRKDFFGTYGIAVDRLPSTNYAFKNLRTRPSTFAYIASVTRPVCVFCWLG